MESLDMTTLVTLISSLIWNGVGMVVFVYYTVSLVDWLIGDEEVQDACPCAICEKRRAVQNASRANLGQVILIEEISPRFIAQVVQSGILCGNTECRFCYKHRWTIQRVTKRE